MKAVHYKIRNNVFSILDVFYPLFRHWMPLQTYHYAACGGSNTLLSLFIFWFSNNFVYKLQPVHFGFLTFKPYVAALLTSFFITFPIGFYLSMFVVFQGSYLKRRVQFFRYFVIVIACMGINYVSLKFFVGLLHWYPTPSQILTTAIVICFSYFSQRHFSFRGNQSAAAAMDASRPLRVSQDIFTGDS